MAKGVHDQCVKTNLDALLIELYVHLVITSCHRGNSGCGAGPAC